MKVISIPRKLLCTAGLLVLCAPFAAIQVALWVNAPLWKLPLRGMTLAAVMLALVMFPLVWLWLNGRRWALTLILAAGGTWCALTILHALEIRSFGMGFLAVALCLYWLGFLIVTRREMRRSYLNPRMRWYQGFPKPLPGMEAWIHEKSQELPVRISRLDEDGVFVFHELDPILELQKSRSVEMMLKYRDASIRVAGRIMTVIEEPDGKVRAGGIQFSSLSSDRRKELGDFIEVIRGAGHV